MIHKSLSLRLHCLFVRICNANSKYVLFYSLILSIRTSNSVSLLMQTVKDPKSNKKDSVEFRVHLHAELISTLTRDSGMKEALETCKLITPLLPLRCNIQKTKTKNCFYYLEVLLPFFSCLLLFFHFFSILLFCFPFL